MDQREAQRERQMVLNKVANDFSALVHRINAGFALTVQMHRLCMLSINSPDLYARLEEARNCLVGFMDEPFSYWNGETATLSRKTLLVTIENTMEFFAANSVGDETN